MGLPEALLLRTPGPKEVLLSLPIHRELILIFVVLLPQLFGNKSSNFILMSLISNCLRLLRADARECRVEKGLGTGQRLAATGSPSPLSPTPLPIPLLPLLMDFVFLSLKCTPDQELWANDTHKLSCLPPGDF